MELLFIIGWFVCGFIPCLVILRYGEDQNTTTLCCPVLVLGYFSMMILIAFGCILVLDKLFTKIQKKISIHKRN